MPVLVVWAQWLEYKSSCFQYFQKMTRVEPSHQKNATRAITTLPQGIRIVLGRAWGILSVPRRSLCSGILSRNRPSPRTAPPPFRRSCTSPSNFRCCSWILHAKAGSKWLRHGQEGNAKPFGTYRPSIWQPQSSWRMQSLPDKINPSLHWQPVQNLQNISD